MTTSPRIEKVRALWDRTVKHYNDNKPKDRERRNERSLETKWSELKRDVARYSGCYSNVVDAHHSGENDEDTIKRAKELYVTKDPKAEFQSVDQWTFLKDCLRFALCLGDMKQKAPQKSARKQKGKGRNSGENDPTNVEAVVDVDLEAEGDNGRRHSSFHSLNVDGESAHGGEQRPMGNKVAKRLRAEENSNRIMACAQREMVEISKKRLKITELQERKDLFTLKVADLDPECQAYFRRCREKELQIAMSMLDRVEEDEAAARQKHYPRTPVAQVREETPYEDGAEEEETTPHQSYSIRTPLPQVRQEIPQPEDGAGLWSDDS